MNKSRIFSRRTHTFLQLVIIVFCLVITVSAQSSSVDSAFNPAISKLGSGGFSNFTAQPDGKILSYGNFELINGIFENNLVRLNPDGTLDTSFRCAACSFVISSAIVQPDGKIIIGGGGDSAHLLRLNADGSTDTSFIPFGNTLISPPIILADVRAIQTDGKILVVLLSSSQGSLSFNLNRFNPNGTFDRTFTPINVGGGQSAITLPGEIAVLPNGKILAASSITSGGSRSSQIKRYNSDGTPDAAFVVPSFTGTAGSSGNGYIISDFAVLPDGSSIIVGNFDSVNAVTRVNIVKLQPDGNVDLSFVPRNVFRSGETGYQVGTYSNGAILISTLTSNLPTNRFIRLNADGSIDTSFIPPATPLLIYRFFTDSANNVLFFANFMENGVTTGKFGRLDAGGSLNSSFTVNYESGGSVKTLAVQPDGKIIIAGNFQNVGGVPHINFARINADGTLDPTFNTGTGFDGTVSKIIVLPDGKILVGGSFPSFNGTERSALVRLNADGSLDTTFDAKIIGGIYAVTRQADGKILIGGLIYTVAGQTRTGISRLNPDGSLDTVFNPLLGGDPSNFAPSVRGIIALPDGKILVGGSFSDVNGFNRANLARLNADGTLDATFNAGSISPIFLIESSPNGKYIVSGGGKLFRLNADGTADDTFQSLVFTTNNLNYQAVTTILVQPDGSVIVGGSFTNIKGIARSNVARLRANGTLDASLFPVGANGAVSTISSQPDGKLLIGGDFTLIENVTRLGLARLTVAPVRVPSVLFDFDGDGRADLSFYRPSNNTLYQLFSRDNSFRTASIGSSNDKLAFADYDGDGKTDFAIFREENSGSSTQAFFYNFNSSTGTYSGAQFGKTGDIPFPGDWDGDGKADYAVYRNAEAAGGQNYFFYRPSSVPGIDFVAIPWGILGDKPVLGDFDGDGRLDAAVYRPSNGFWYILQSSNAQVVQQQFGLATDLPVPADYNGDGRTDIAVYRPSNGVWYTSTTPQNTFGAVQFGTAGDVPVPADYDGDGKADIAVYRPSAGVWYLLRSSAGFTGIQFGTAEDRPVSGIYNR